MVLRPRRGKMLLRRERKPTRQRPRAENALVLEPEIPVQPPRMVLLDDEPGHGRLVLAAPRGLGAGREVPLAAVRVKTIDRHAASYAPYPAAVPRTRGAIRGTN